jgi:hypothetical protein
VSPLDTVATGVKVAMLDLSQPGVPATVPGTDLASIVAVRQDAGEPEPDDGTITRLAEAAYQAHPEAIPYESARYRAYADLDHNGFVEGQTELLPHYLAAARDYSQPIFAYGVPRLVRLGVELLF